MSFDRCPVNEIEPASAGWRIDQLRKAIPALFLTAVLAALAGHLSAETFGVETWKSAAEKEGPDSIVYSDLRSDAERAQRDKDRACGEEFSCIANDKFRGNAVIAAQNSLRKDLKEIEEAKSSGKMSDSDYEKATERVEERLSEVDEQRRELIEEAQKREELAKECARARRATMEVYQKYLERLESDERESSNKDSAEFIRKLIEKTKQSIEDHVRPHDEATKAAANCRSAVESLGTLKKLHKGDLAE
jgi:hypothetical protein